MNGFVGGGHRPLYSLDPFLVYFSLNLLLVSVLGTTVSMRWYFGLIKVAQVVQLLQESVQMMCNKKVCCFSWHSLKSLEDIKKYTITQEELNRAAERHQPSSNTSIYSFVS